MTKCIKCGREISSRATKCRFCFTDQVVNPKEIGDIIISTSNNFEGFEIIEYYDLIHGEIVCPNGLLGAITNGTFFTFSAMHDAREKAIEDIRAKARRLGANAIINVDIDIADLAGKGVLVSANGTPVYIVQQGFIEKYAQRKKIEKESAQQKKEIELQNKELVENLIKKANINEFNELDKMIVKQIVNNPSCTPMSIVKMLPKNVAPSEIKESFNKLIESGLIIKNDAGFYSVSKEKDDYLNCGIDAQKKIEE